MAVLLTIDIGNTSTTVATMTGGRSGQICRYPRANGTGQNLEQLQKDFRGCVFDGIALTSVVPALSARWANGASALFSLPCWELTVEQDLPVPIDYPKPSRIGPDRIANAAAAWCLYGAPAIVADFGTALTFDILVPERGYIGGVIAPGIGMMYDYLSEKTAMLPSLEPMETTEVIGRSTEQAMHAGAMFGYRGMVREIWHELRRATGFEDMPLLATGGLAGTVLKDFGEPVQIVPDLTLQGLVAAWNHANPKSQNA